MIVEICEEEARAKSRLVAIRLASLTLRCMENWRREVGGYDEAMILVAVVSITSDRLLRTELPEDLKNLNAEIPTSQLGECNIASIAVATGLNRETVRRKVSRLVQDGYLSKNDNGRVGLTPGIVQEARALTLIRSQLDSIRKIAENLLNDGIFQIR